MAGDLTDSEKVMVAYFFVNFEGVYLTFIYVLFKVAIAVGLLQDAPPGQVKMVLNDIRVLLGEDRPEVFR